MAMIIGSAKSDVLTSPSPPACNVYIVFAASLVVSEKDTKLRAHTENLAFKLRSFVG